MKNYEKARELIWIAKKIIFPIKCWATFTDTRTTRFSLQTQISEIEAYRFEI